MRAWVLLLTLMTVGLVNAAANGSVITTPSGNIYVTYVDKDTVLVINFNKNKVLTVNIKANMTDNYYVHLVTHVRGYYSNTTSSQIAELLSQIKNVTNQAEVLNTLKTLATLLLDTNETRKIETKLMVMTKSLNSTRNATWLKTKIEYEFERQIRRLNQTTIEEAELKIKGWAKEWSQVVTVLQTIINTAPLDPKTTAAIQYLVTNIKNITDMAKYKLETAVNGTKIEIKIKNGKYEIEIETDQDSSRKSSKDDDRKGKGGDERKGGSGGDSRKSDEDERDKSEKDDERKNGRGRGDDRDDERKKK